MNVHTRNNDPGSDTQNLAMDLAGDLNEEMERMISPSVWEMIHPRDIDGPLIAFYIFLLLFLLALARAICC
jgi:hypothetical protein